MNDVSPLRSRALLLTIGTGDQSKPEETLYIPVLKSIDSEQWDRVILLPSRSSKTDAESIAGRRPVLDVRVLPLLADGDENNPDVCYAHFEQEIGRLRDDGLEPRDITADFTRGTKAMSAALVLAAARNDVASLRYISGDRDGRGTVVAGSEKIIAISPTIATAQKRLDTALRFTECGNFAGALTILRDDTSARGAPGEATTSEVAAIRSILDFYAAWDRLDYKSACTIELEQEPQPADWRAVWPTSEMIRWVDLLAAPVPRSDHPAMARRLRLLCADLLANGERRIRDRHFEDAVLRAYRVLELVGQLRLFARNLDSSSLPADNPAVQRLEKKLENKGSAPFGKNPRNGNRTAGREQVARLLKELGDPLAPKLLAFDKQPALPRVSERNDSVLIHGFASVGPEDAEPLRNLYEALEKLLLEDDPDAHESLLAARSLWVSAPGDRRVPSQSKKAALS